MKLILVQHGLNDRWASSWAGISQKSSTVLARARSCAVFLWKKIFLSVRTPTWWVDSRINWSRNQPLWGVSVQNVEVPVTATFKLYHPVWIITSSCQYILMSNGNVIFLLHEKVLLICFCAFTKACAFIKAFWYCWVLARMPEIIA